jgi:hypothetical protein
MPVRRVLLLAAGVFFAPMVGQPAVAGLRIMGSPPHRANILRRKTNLFGVGTYISRGRIWVTVNVEQTTPGWP